MLKNYRSTSMLPGSHYSVFDKVPQLPVAHLLCIGVMSWVVFSIVCVLFGTLYHGHATFVWAFVGIGCLISLAKMIRERPFSLSGLFCFLALVAATWVGSATYRFVLGQYWDSSELEIRTNVLPSEDAVAYMNAGEIVFADEARLDWSRALGYKHHEVYCVVPVTDDTLEKVQFWAAGLNCCSARGTFTCDDAWNPKAKSGIVLRNVSHAYPPLHVEFAEAVKQAEAAFDIASAEDPIFVRWVADPEQVSTNLGRTGFGILAVASALWLVGGWLVVVVMYELRKGLVEGRDRS